MESKKIPENLIKWLNEVRKKTPIFLRNMEKEKGAYKYSYSGDIYPGRWGLGNSVFALKIMYSISMRKNKEVLDFVKSFQNKNGYFHDPYVKIVSFPIRILVALKNKDIEHLTYKKTKRAETRQAISALKLYGEKPKYVFKDVPKTKRDVKIYLEKLNWKRPWGAGANFSHLMFFIENSRLNNKKELINTAINWVKNIENKKGGWYLGNPSKQQKINGAMKILTGMKIVNKFEINYPKKLIDLCLSSINDRHACDNFNIIYVLRYTKEKCKTYRKKEIRNFAIERLKIYKRHYFPEIGGFSFRKEKAASMYYGAFVSKGKAEPDIHGTTLFVWGISVISNILGENFGFKEYDT